MGIFNFNFRQMFKFVTPVMVVASLLILAPGPASAQSQDENGSQRKTEKTPAMSQQVYKALTTAQGYVEKKQFKEGLAELRKLEERRNLTPYEKAQMYNYFAYTYFTMENYKDAISSYEKVLEQPDLPNSLLTNSLYTLAQLYFIQEDYKNAIVMINRWIKASDTPNENAYLLLGQAYYQLQKYKEALEPLKTAYKIVKDKKGTPKENLLLLLRVVYFNLNDYPHMLDVIKELVSLYPKSEYWLTLAGVYSELKDYKKQMSILEILYDRGELDKGNQILNLANLYLLNDVPYKAAVIIDKGVKEGKIEKDVRNLRLLSQAWLQADYPAKSVQPLEQATRMSNDGDLNVRLAQAYINLDRYKEAVDTLEEGFKKGGIKRKDQANIMLGMSLFELSKYDAAKDAFRAATEDKRSRKSAEQWLSYVHNEQTRQEQLEASLKARRR